MLRRGLVIRRGNLGKVVDKLKKYYTINVSNSRCFVSGCRHSGHEQ